MLYLNLQSMIRRSPTRIELKLDDLQEHEAIRQCQESRREQQATGKAANDTWLESLEKKTKQEAINERIGFSGPQPRVL